MQSSITFEVETNIKECEKLWRIFSRDIYYSDLWEYRICFYDENYCKIHFMVGKTEGKIIGILPLWNILQDNSYEFFGGEFFERNFFMIKDSNLIPAFIENLPKETYLHYIEKSQNELHPLKEITKRYYMNLEKFDWNFDKYLETFSKKHRKNMKRDLKIVSSLNLNVLENNMNDFELLVKLSDRRFQEDSFLHEEIFIKGFKKLLETAKKRNELHLLSIQINEKTESVQAAILFKGIYYVLLGGNNLEISNIGKLMIVKHIENAIKFRAKEMDFLSTDSGWKDLWNLEAESHYGYTNSKDDFYFDY